MRRTLLFLVSSSVLTLSGCNCGKTQGLLETSGILVVTPDTLEFGAVTEFTQKTSSISLENAGRGALTLSVALEAGTSSEFTLGAAPVELAPGAKVDVQITFAAMGAGQDLGAAIITSDEKDRGPVRVPLHGGAIWPVLRFDPDPLAFAPVTSPLVTKLAVLRNVGGATLHVSAIGVNPGGNPDFSLMPPLLPLSLAPDASVPVAVVYARSLNSAEGLLQVVSDEPIDGGVRGLRLLPDPAKVCGDGLDNDNDGLIDFPDDPGCTSAEDGDEYNPPECVTGGVQPCGSTMGACRQGSRVCANSLWGGCDGGVRPMAETCNGQDDDCNGMSDENLSELCTINGCSGARACVPNSGTDGGLFTACIPVSSMPEVCNGLDDNCNGLVDEGVVQTCTVFGCLGVRICVPGSDGGFTSCMPTNPLPETCNGVDDNCNGVVDDLPDLICGLGPCRRVAQACVDGGVGACVPGVGTAETCNGVDDNCNGTIDDGIAPLSCGVGACANSANACLFDGGMNMCVPLPPSVERCNNIDDNCNGLTDELTDAGPITQACYTGAIATRNVGRCKDGLQNCVTGAFSSACNGQVLPNPTEICPPNGIDDNCNGQVDEGCSTCDPLVSGTWYQHHSFNPATGLPTPKNASQFVQVEMGATRITPPAAAFPLTISHVRVLGQAPQVYTIRIFDDSFGVPGAQLGSQVFTSNGTYQVVTLATPVTVTTSQPIWVALQGAADSMTVRGDGNGEATSNLIYGCDAYLPPTCFGSWSWKTFDSFGAPFAAVDDLIIAIAKCP